MGTASIEVSGPDAEQLAWELHSALAATASQGEAVRPVEVERSAELVIAIIGLVFAGVDSAKTIWDWWHERQSTGATVKILLADGTRVELSGISQEQLQIEFAQRVQPDETSR